jgi:DNA (cytosine-5)-methyltransferase 1
MATESKRPIGVDLFSGAGGMSLGFEQAGFDVRAAVEIDPIHAAIHKFNFPNCTMLARSVVGLTGNQIRKAAGIKSDEVDVVFGGAPCQGFSLIGQRAIDDPRNSLVKEFVRIVKELDARYFVFENVKGITVGKHKQFLEEIIDAFEGSGYQVRTPWRVLNAVDYGVPQYRERLILLGAKKGLTLPSYPTPTHHPAGKVESRLLLAGPSCRDALGDLPEPEDYPELKVTDAVSTNLWGKPSAYVASLRCETAAGWHYGYRRKWNASLLTSSMRTEHTEISRRRFAETAGGNVEPISRFFRLPEAGISNTLRAGTDSARGAFTSPRPIHYSMSRCITVREMARLHGFPDWFRFHVTKWHGARQIGNAVPPPLARAVASAIISSIGYKPTQQTATLDLGDEKLLSIDMAEAAAYWDVPVVIGRRDKKSGAKKRKQETIEAEHRAVDKARGMPTPNSAGGKATRQTKSTTPKVFRANGRIA